MATLQDVVNRYVSWEGRFWYGMEGNVSDPSWGRLNPVASGYGDCSSTIWRAYWDLLGIDIGKWTGEQKTRGSRLLTGSYTNGWNPGGLEPGDLVLMGPSAGNITHVEMYVGGGQFSGHGGEIEPGPWRKNAADYLRRWPYWEARRYAASTSESFTPTKTFYGEDSMRLIHAKGDNTIYLMASDGAVIALPNPEFLHVARKFVVGQPGTSLEGINARERDVLMDISRRFKAARK